MNHVVMLAIMVSSLGVATMRSLLIRYFPYLPTEFDSVTTPADYYDFIVVGAGCGGSVVASRLSETSASVLLLEAGPSAPPESVASISRFFGYFINSNAYWNYEIKQQNNAYLGFINNTQTVRHGKVMGGTSTINGMIYTRGNKMDYDSWARLGNIGWDYDSVLPYFKKSENLHAPDFVVEEKYHGRNGPLNVSKTEADSDLIKQFLMAGQQLGYKTIDPNSAYNLGFYSAHKTQRNGVRASASESFLGPVADRSNLQIRTNALVTRVLFNKKRRAVGVEYVIDGKKRAVLARKEVILSAGAVRSPQLLLLSGVGPRGHLEEMGIPVVADVPGVGRNLHDHPFMSIPFIVKQGTFYSSFESLTIEAFTEFITNASGPLTALSGEGWALMNVGGGIHPSWPDVLIALSSDTLSTAGAELTADQFGYRPEIFEDTFGNLDGSTSFALMPLLVRPKSRGSITLRSTNPADNPVIDINMFYHPDDIKLFVKAIRKCIDIARTPAFRDALDVRVPDHQLKQCRSHGRDTDAYWECYSRHMVSSAYHLSSSVMMAPPSNPMGVVSQRLSVRGVTGLRVVDSSIMPHNIGGNPMATTYMIGEKGADFIKHDWGYFTENIT